MTQKCFLSHLFESAVFLSFHPDSLSTSGRYKACCGSHNHQVTAPVAFQIVGKSKAGQLACHGKIKKRKEKKSGPLLSFIQKPLLFLFNFINLLLPHSSLALATSHRVASGINTWKPQRARTNKVSQHAWICACAHTQTYVAQVC